MAVVHFPFSSIALTKLDILDTLPEIKIGIAYTVDGKALPSFPGNTLFLISCSSLLVCHHTVTVFPEFFYSMYVFSLFLKVILFLKNRFVGYHTKKIK